MRIISFEILDSGAINAPRIHNVVGTNGNIQSGTYTPNLFAVTSNIVDFVTNETQWMRVGNVATVSGVVEIELSTSGTFEFALTNPTNVNSNFTHLYQLAGTAALDTDAVVLIVADVGNDRARFLGSSPTSGSKTIVFHYTYLVV
jgi:hypothetical protein